MGKFQIIHNHITWSVHFKCQVSNIKSNSLDFYWHISNIIDFYIQSLKLNTLYWLWLFVIEMLKWIKMENNTYYKFARSLIFLLPSFTFKSNAGIFLSLKLNYNQNKILIFFTDIQNKMVFCVCKCISKLTGSVPKWFGFAW